LERETGLEPATLCLGSLWALHRIYLKPQTPFPARLGPLPSRRWALCLRNRVAQNPVGGKRAANGAAASLRTSRQPRASGRHVRVAYSDWGVSAGWRVATRAEYRSANIRRRSAASASLAASQTGQGRKSCRCRFYGLECGELLRIRGQSTACNCGYTRFGGSSIFRNTQMPSP